MSGKRRGFIPAFRPNFPSRTMGMLIASNCEKTMYDNWAPDSPTVFRAQGESRSALQDKNLRKPIHD